MIKIAITGNIACGKSVAFDVIKSEGFSIVDCDDMVKDLYKNSDFINDLKKTFPEIILNETVNTKLLSEKLFSDINFKQSYENFIYPKIKVKILEFLNQNKGEKVVFVVIPLLFEAGFENLFDKIVFISAKEEIRKTRLVSRKSMLSDIADKVISSQQKEEEKISKSDYVIKNNAALEEFKCDIKKLLNNLI